jgi:hypothetical protein
MSVHSFTAMTKNVAYCSFIKDGFERGEKAYHIIDPKRRDEHLQRLVGAGIDVAAAHLSGQFELCTWADAYLRDGHFDQDRMLALIQEVLEGGRQQGFPLTRWVTHMEWALEDRPGADDLMEYEARANVMLPVCHAATNGGLWRLRSSLSNCRGDLYPRAECK